MPHLRELFDLSGRVALVTGGSRGLGLEMAEGLAEAGAAVVLAARREQWLTPAIAKLQAAGFRCEGVPCDVTEPEQVEAAVRRAMESFGQLDVLVNNAGVAWGAPPEDMPLDKWRMVVDVNLTGTFLCAQHAARVMLESGEGSIINIASIAGLVGSPAEAPSAAGYAASKGGVIALTRELASRWGRRGIRVNCIAPGYFPSRLTEKVLPFVEKRFQDLSPQGRVGRPGEIKGVVVFLASAAASHITGQTIVVDGGASIV
jgi:gluconate 5-dehydrogenase